MRFQLGYICHAPATYKDSGHWPPAAAEELVTAEEVAAWRARWRATCSDRVAALLAALERDYAPQDAA